MILELSPFEYACIKGIPISDVFLLIRQNQVPYYMTEDGIQIPVTYSTDTP